MSYRPGSACCTGTLTTMGTRRLDAGSTCTVELWPSAVTTVSSGRPAADSWISSGSSAVLMNCRRYTFSIRSEEHTSELQSRENLVCRLLLEQKNKQAQRSN